MHIHRYFTDFITKLGNSTAMIMMAVSEENTINVE